jgi:hypothetical protein
MRAATLVVVVGVLCGCRPEPIVAKQPGIKLFLSIDGPGSVSSASVAPPLACVGPIEACTPAELFADDSSVTLTAKPETGSDFLGWEFIDGFPVETTVDVPQKSGAMKCTFAHESVVGPVDVDLTTPTLVVAGGTVEGAKPTCTGGLVPDESAAPLAYRIVALFGSGAE